MASLNIGIFGNNMDLMKKIAGAFGKKETSSDICLYGTKISEKIITSIVPITYPEKIQSIFYVIHLCDFPVLVVGDLDSSLGEVILSLDSGDFKKGIIFSEEYKKDQVKQLIKGTSLENYEFFDYKNEVSINELRIKVFSEEIPIIDENKGYVVIDHSFGVKGVGTVVLGVLRGGILEVYDKLFIEPGNKKTVVKSIQKHDDNFQKAQHGDRVGLSLKDVSVEDVPRGKIISKNAISSKELNLEITLNKFSSDSLKPGKNFYICVGMEYCVFKVESGEISPGERGNVSIKFEKEISYMPGQKFYVLNPNAKMRIVGNGTFMGAEV